MTAICLLQLHRYSVLILAVVVLSRLRCSCVAAQQQQQQQQVPVVYEYKKAHYARKASSQFPFVMMIPRGGDGGDLTEALSDTVQDAVVDVAIGPWIQKHTVLIVKTIISSFFVAQILAYCGVIGEKGEGLYEWAQDNKSAMNVTFIKIIKVVQHNLESMLISFANLPDRAQFVTCVSIGASLFPLTVKTVAATSVVTLVGFVIAEILTHIGFIGDEIHELVEESETTIRFVKRWIHRKRLIMRKQLNIEALLKAVWTSLRNDRVFWAGLGVGAIASIVLDDATVSQGIEEQDVKKLMK